MQRSGVWFFFYSECDLTSQLGSQPRGCDYPPETFHIRRNTLDVSRKPLRHSSEGFSSICTTLCHVPSINDGRTRGKNGGNNSNLGAKIILLIRCQRPAGMRTNGGAPLGFTGGRINEACHPDPAASVAMETDARAPLGNRGDTVAAAASLHLYS